MSLPENLRDHAGISRPNPFVDRPLVATIGTLPPAVTRMTVLHELAHIIYDATGCQRSEEPERWKRSAPSASRRP